MIGRRPATTVRRAGPLAVLTTLVALVCGCSSSSDTASGPGGQSAAHGAAYPVMVSNCGRSMKFATAPKRVVILQPLLARDMITLGLGDRIIGQVGTDYVDPEPGMGTVPVLSSKNVATTETLVGARPDLVISDLAYRLTPSQGGASMDQLSKLAVPSYVATAGCNVNGTGGKVADQFTDLENLGRIFGVESKAAALVSKLKGQLADVQRRVAGQSAVTVFEGTSYDSQYYPVVGIGLDALTLAGGTSIFPDVTDANASISKEQITARDPQAIVDSYSTPKVDRQKSTAALKAAFPTVQAVRNDRIHFINYVESEEPGSAIAMVNTVRELAQFLHPTAFTN